METHINNLGCVLVLEDTASIREMVTDTLEIKGYQVVGAETLADARARMRHGSFDVALFDLMLPDGNGLDLIPEFRSVHPDTPILIGTAYATIDSAITALNRGAYGFVTKPFAMDALVHLIGEAAMKRRLELENRRLVADLKAINFDLQRANAELKKLDELKSAFVSNVSHEFKSPLGIMKGWLDALSEDKSTPVPDTVARVLATLGKTVNRLMRLVKDLLDIQKIEAGKLELRREPVDLTSLVREVLEDFAPAFQEKRLDVASELAPGVGLTGDPDRITQAFINLLSNGVKYTPEGGRIEVRVSGTDREAILEVKDSGPGIARENLGKIFDKFTRVTEERIEGTGLGLPIAFDIVRLHGGLLTVESEPGQGSRFTALIPRLAPVPGAAAPR